MKKSLGAVCAALLTLSACGGGGDRPSVDDLSSSIAEGGFFGTGTAANEATAECLAEALAGSDLSDAALQSIVDGDTSYSLSSEDAEALNGASSAIAECTVN